MLGIVISEPRARAFHVQLTVSADTLVGMMAEGRRGILRWGIHLSLNKFFARKESCC